VKTFGLKPSFGLLDQVVIDAAEGDQAQRSYPSRELAKLIETQQVCNRGPSVQESKLLPQEQPLDSVTRLAHGCNVGSSRQGGSFLKEARSPYFGYLKIDVAVTCQLFFGYHSKANSKTYPLIP
jgi:hypothetical protein